LKMLADEFNKVTVVSVVGNHGRNSIKPISKNRVRDNFDWLFSSMLKRQFDKAGDKRFNWIIAEGHKQPFQVYGTKFIASHGDEAHGGSGIASLLSPLMIQATKKQGVEILGFAEPVLHSVYIWNEEFMMWIIPWAKISRSAQFQPTHWMPLPKGPE